MTLAREDTTASRAATMPPILETGRLEALYRDMRRIRRFEERVLDVFKSGAMAQSREPLGRDLCGCNRLRGKP